MIRTALFAVLTLAAFASSAEVEWRFPRLGNCHEGMPFSDGVTGVLVWGGEDAINLTVGRADLWDHRGGYPWLPEQCYTNIAAAVETGDTARLTGLFRKNTPKGEPRNPYMLPLGRVVVKLDPMWRIMSGTLDTETGIGKLQLLKMESSRGKDPNATIQIAMANWGGGMFAMKIPNGVKYAVEVVPAMTQPKVRKALEPVGFSDAVLKTNGLFGCVGGGFTWYVPGDRLVAVDWWRRNDNELFLRTDRKESFPWGGPKPTYDIVARASIAYWRKFWSEGARVKVPDPVLQRAFDYGMYRFGAMMELVVHEVNGRTEYFRGCPASWQDVSFENIRLSDGRKVSGRRVNGFVSVRESPAGASSPENRLQPPMPRRLLSLKTDKRNGRNGEGDLIKLSDGTIYLAYTEYVTEGWLDHAPAHIVERRSSDGGTTWTAPKEVFPVEGSQNDRSVSLLRLKDGRLAMVNLRRNSNSDCVPVIRFSSDEAKTWSKPVECMPAAETDYYIVNNARLTQLENGRLLIPLARHSAKVDRGDKAKGRLSCVYSDDAGKTWKKGGECLVNDTRGNRITVQEPGLIPLKDGRLCMYVRTDVGCQWRGFSADGGVTWSDFGPSSLLGPRAPATVRRLADGRLLAVWNDHEGHPEYKDMGGWGRVPLTIGYSSDEGKTWIDRKVVEPDLKGFFCYVATLFDGDDLLLHYYCRPCLNESCVTRVPGALK